MIDAEKIRKQAINKYPDVVQAILGGESPFPLKLRYSRIKTTADRDSILRDVETLRSESREVRGQGLTIDWQTIDTNKYGRNKVPGDISFAREEDYFGYINRIRELKTIRSAANILTEEFPVLSTLLPNHWRVLRSGDDEYWNNVCKVLRFLRDNPFPDKFARELPIAVPTKFVEQNRNVLEEILRLVAPQSILEEGENLEERIGLRTPDSLIECRLLDPELFPEWSIRQFTVSVRDLQKLDRVQAANIVITENRTNFLTLPPLQSTIAIQGQGFGVSRLKRVPFLQQRHVFYWGDLDTHGFEILAILRREIPKTRSVLMDVETWEQFSEYQHQGVKSRTKPENVLPYLTEAEKELYAQLRSTEKRLEQERIPQSKVIDALNQLPNTGRNF